MKIYNEDKTQILEEYDLTKGYLRDDILATELEAIEEVQEEGHYETIKEYPSGGKDVEWVVDIEGVEGREAQTIEEPIRVYIEYTSEELKNRENQELLEQYKKTLSESDYKAIKYAEGYYTEEEYKPIKDQRESYRIKIRELENEIYN